MGKLLVAAIAALGRNRELGKDGALLWRIPDDLQRFKRLTMGHPVIFGRKTFESIGKPLSGRTNIVVSRTADPRRQLLCHGSVVFVRSIEEAIETAQRVDGNEMYIGGGAQVYEQALPYIDKLYLTRIDDEKEGDSFFPPYEHLFTKKVFEEERRWNGLTYHWIDLEREKKGNAS